MQFSRKARLALVATAAAAALAASAAVAAVITGQGWGVDRESACRIARSNAEVAASYPVKSFGPCDCAHQGSNAPRHAQWKCTVQAQY